MTTPFLLKVLGGVLTAVTVGAGASVIKANSVNAVQDNRIATLEKSSEQMKSLSEKLDETNRNVAVLNERLKQQEYRNAPRNY